MRRTDLAEQFLAHPTSVWELVVSIPTPRCDHRQLQYQALAEQSLISAGIVFTHLVRHMGEIELYWPAATRLQVHEEQPVLRPEQIARVWLAVQQLFGRAPPSDRPPQISQRVTQKLPVRIPEVRSVVAAINEPLRLGDAIREVWRSKIDLPHTSVQPLKCLRILGWRDLLGRYRLVVGPQVDDEVVTHVDARLHSRFKRSHRAIGSSEPPSHLDFELCARLIRRGRDPGNEVTRQHAHGEPVRVVKNDRVVGPQAKR